MMRSLWRAAGWLLLVAVLLQLYFIARIALMRVVDPGSTTFQRSELARLAVHGHFNWQQQWVPYGQISSHLKRAVIASEDSDFIKHDGVEWEAIQVARERNAAAQARAQAERDRIAQQAQRQQERARKQVEQLEKRGRPVSPQLRAVAEGSASAPGLPQARPAKIYGGSTISQQLAKNLLLSGERSLLRKGQELLLTQYLELLLGKQRILEIYLNSVEWGQGVFGAEAAARRYFGKSAAQLSAYEAAKLAVMLPRPRYFEQQFNSGYLNGRASTIAARMGDVAEP